MDDGDRVPVIALMMARLVGAVVFAGMAVIALIYVLIEQFRVPLVAFSVVLLLVMVAMQVFYFTRPGVDLHSPFAYALLVVQALLIYLPLLFVYRYAWIGTPVLLAGTVLVVLPRVLGWVVYAAIVASAALILNALVHDLVQVFYIIVSVSTFGLQVYGLTVLAGLITERSRGWRWPMCGW